MSTATSGSTQVPQQNPQINQSGLNSAGLKPEESKNLAERQPEKHEAPIFFAVQELYSGNARDSTFTIYNKNSSFRDPISISDGIDSIRSQFSALKKFFPRIDILNFRLLKNPSTVDPKTILIDQDVAYYTSKTANEPTKVVNSLITLRLDERNKVKSHIEDWDHKKSSTGDDGWMGKINEMRKRIAANLTDTFFPDLQKIGAGPHN
ncbi:hypothetical protein BJ165DRAFT_1521817 [Panaeolus papilionaceus]|nr:hypothetical protein BJ165DRAFT_1521817 [Panaeolus papilionaceus]